MAEVEVEAVVVDVAEEVAVKGVELKAGLEVVSVPWENHRQNFTLQI
jgi:hypothetical protein